MLGLKIFPLALLLQLSFALQPTGTLLGQEPVDFSQGVEVPKAELGVTVTYLADGSLYAYSDEEKTNEYIKRTCVGVSIGPYCCIGIKCNARKRGLISDPSSEKLTLDVQDPQVKVNSLTVHPDGSADISYSTVGADGGRTDATCIGVHIGNCCFGVCVL